MQIAPRDRVLVGWRPHTRGSEEMPTTNRGKSPDDAKEIMDSCGCRIHTLKAVCDQLRDDVSLNRA